MRKLLLGAVMVLSALAVVYAEDKQTDAIIAGKVVSIEEVAHLSDAEGLWAATIAVEKVIKNHALITSETVQVYFLWSGKAKDNSPKHVELTKGEKGEFHLDARPLMENREVFFLDTEADVKS